MKTWFISDTHFFHEKIKSYCGRPDDWHSRILENLKCVGPEDTLVHLGDVVFRYNRQAVANLLATLPGAVRILIEGNHDDRSRVRTLPIWSEVYREHAVLTRIAFQEPPLEKELQVSLTHNPKDFGNLTSHIFLHGHIHEKGKPWRWDDHGALWVNLSVEQWSYAPVEFGTILEIYNEKRQYLL